MIKLDKVTKIYYNNGVVGTGFSKVSLNLDVGEFVVIVGESGSGKSTLLNVISGLDTYEEGEMYINGKETSHYSEEDMQDYRRKYISNIFQSFNIINSYTVKQNVELALVVSGRDSVDSRKRLKEILKKTGLWELRNRRASKLSGGQKQRVAIARALVQDTPIIVCDEPTGNLDSENSKEIFKLLKEVSEDKLVIVVTHNYEYVEKYATRLIKMSDGAIVEDSKLKETKVIEDIKVKNYKKMGFGASFKIAWMNVISTPIKCLLAVGIFFVASLALFEEIVEYSNVIESELVDGIDDAVFVDMDPRRIIVSKRDKSKFSDEEIEKFKKMDSIIRVDTKDQFNDFSTYFEFEIGEYPVYVSTLVKRLDDLDNPKLVYGRMPKKENEVIFEGSNFYYAKDIDKNALSGSSGDNETITEISVVGYFEKDKIGSGIGTMYVSDSIYTQLLNNSPFITKNITKELDDTLLEMYDTIINNSVPEGTAWITEKVAQNSCERIVDEEQAEDVLDFEVDCSKNKVILKMKTPFYKKELSLGVSRVVNEEDFDKLLDSNSFYSYDGSLFINEKDFENLVYNNEIYQIALYVENKNKILDIVDEVKKDNRYYAVAVAYTYDNDTIFTFAFKVIMILFHFGLILLAGAIAYFLIRFILKSRMPYFAVVRMLGGTTSVSKKLVRLELCIYSTISFVILVILALVFIKYNVCNIVIPSDVYYLLLKPTNFVYCYLSSILMSLFIARMFSKKVFKDSMINTYNMEV